MAAEPQAPELHDGALAPDRRERAEIAIDERGGRDAAADHVEHDAERLRQDESGEEHGQRLAPDELDRRDEAPGEPPAAFAGQSIGEIGDRKEMDDAQRREMRLVDQRTERLMDLAEPRHGSPSGKARPAILAGERHRRRDDEERAEHEPAVIGRRHEPAAPEAETEEEQQLPRERVEEPEAI